MRLYSLMLRAPADRAIKVPKRGPSPPLWPYSWRETVAMSTSNMRILWQGVSRSGESLKRVRLSKQRPRGTTSAGGTGDGSVGAGGTERAAAGAVGAEGEAVEDDQETRWLRFHDSIHKAQRDNNHPTETLKFIAIALSALGEVLQEAMRRSRRRE